MAVPLVAPTTKQLSGVVSNFAPTTKRSYLLPLYYNTVSKVLTTSLHNFTDSLEKTLGGRTMLKELAELGKQFAEYRSEKVEALEERVTNRKKLAFLENELGELEGYTLTLEARLALIAQLAQL